MATTSVHTVLGELENGTKVVMTNVVPDATIGAITLTIDPLKSIYAYFPGIKDCGTIATTVQFAQSATLGNVITATTAASMAGGLIGILSFGV